MHLERFVARGYLDSDGADLIRWESGQHEARIHITVGCRRTLAENLPVCWETLGVVPGATVAVELDGASRVSIEDEQRAIARFSDRLRELLLPPPAAPARRRFRFRGRPPRR